MDVSQVWSITNMMSDICEVITWLRDDPHYTREDAADALETILERHCDPQYQIAMNAKGENI
jgi:hypothetical protein